MGSVQAMQTQSRGVCRLQQIANRSAGRRTISSGDPKAVHSSLLLRHTAYEVNKSSHICNRCRLLWGPSHRCMRTVMATTHSVKSDDLRITAVMCERLDGYVLGPVQHRLEHLATQRPLRPTLTSYLQQGFTATLSCGS